MDATIKKQRQDVVDQALSWLQTPYHPCARLKGVGVDCAQFPAAIYHAAGMISEIPRFDYSPQWHLHQTEELYLQMVERHAVEIPGPPMPGDFVLFKVGNCWAHGAIVTDHPTIIHAVSGRGVVLGNMEQDPFAKKRLINRSPRFFTLWGNQ